MENKQMPTLSVGDYIIGAEIGRGSFAKVYKGFNKKTNKNVAIKSVSRIKLTKKLLDNLEIEINILKASQHVNVVELIECLKSKNHIHLVMEYCSLGDLSVYIKSRKQFPVMQNQFGGLSYPIIQSFASQIGSALEYLRQKNVIHRDIKPQNLLLSPTEGYIPGESESKKIFPILKIADFGFARSLMQSTLADTLCGSPLYMAPEILRYEKYDARADLWSVGAVFYEMCTGKPPFRASNHIELQHKIDKYNDALQFPDDPAISKQPASQSRIPSEIKELVSGLLKRKPENRISFEKFFEMAAFELEGTPALIDNNHRRVLSHANKQITNEISLLDINTPNIRSKVEPSKLPQSPYTGHRNIKSLQTNETVNNLLDNVTNLQAQHSSLVFEAQGRNQTANPPRPVYPRSMVKGDSDRQYTNTISPSSKQFADSRKSHNLKASDNILLEKEYVVIETRAVEINALADGKFIFLLLLNKLEILPQNIPDSHVDARPKGIRPQVLNQISALSQAVSNAAPSYRVKTDSVENVSLNSSHTSFNKVPSSNISKGQSYQDESFSFLDSNLYDKFNSKNVPPEEEATIRQMESLAYKAHSVAWLADMKVSNLQTFEENDKYRKTIDEKSDSKMELLLLLMGTSVDITNGEAFALYLKALSLLHKAIICARSYWNSESSCSAVNKSDGLAASLSSRPSLSLVTKSISYKPSRDTTCGQSGKLNGNDSPTHKGSKVASQAFNNAVQWVRAKFNSCLENADLLKSISADNDIDFSNVSVEKILYEKALELSRAAALKELNWETPFECERAYQLAIWMLSAILEKTSGDPEISSEDLLIVEDFISAAVKRLESLRERISNTINQT